MCGRFDNLITRDAYRGLFKAERLPKSNFPLRYNVAPTRLGGEDILSTAILIGEANPLVGAVHDRMPVILLSED